MRTDSISFALVKLFLSVYALVWGARLLWGYVWGRVRGDG